MMTFLSISGQEFTPKENIYGNTRYLVEAAIISTTYRFFTAMNDEQNDKKEALKKSWYRKCYWQKVSPAHRDDDDCDEPHLSRPTGGKQIWIPYRARIEYREDV